MRRSVTAAVMAASLTVGGAAGAGLFVPSLSGAQTDESTETQTTEETAEDEGRAGFLAEALAPLVDDGTITQSQADAVVEALREARPDHGHRWGHHLGEALTEVLGIERDELRAALADGQTIAEVAEANGVAVDDVIAALVAEAEERIDRAVEDGRLTEEEAAEKRAEATERITALVDGELDAADLGHRHHHRHDDEPAGS